MEAARDLCLDYGLMVKITELLDIKLDHNHSCISHVEFCVRTGNRRNYGS